jgi:hypothetical protein
MSAMSDIDLMLKEYEGARSTLEGPHGSLMGYLQAVDNTIRAANVLANGLRSMLTANGVDREPGGTVAPFHSPRNGVFATDKWGRRPGGV